MPNTSPAARPGGTPAIEVRGLTKRYGTQVAVRDLSFTVEPGRVTGFLGPNGAGKSTTLRLILGLDRPDGGRATIAGRPYRALAAPLRTVGALLEARAVHRGHTASTHLRALARSQGLPDRRADDVLAEVGLSHAARRRTGGFSLGMSQRLGIAAALLGDPDVLILDEPLNGLDPEGIVWVRTLLKQRAAAGRTVLLSSHLMNEMAVTADHLVVIADGRLVADCPAQQLTADAGDERVDVVSPDAPRLTGVLIGAGARVSTDGDRLTVTGMPAASVADLAAGHGIPLHELVTRRPSLEDAFFRLTSRDQRTDLQGALR